MLVLCHGLGEHSGRYAEFCDRLFASGIGSLRFDLRGHGLSGGARGHVDRFTDYLDDLECVWNHFAPRTPAVPWFLFGHSLGGVVVTEYLLVRAPARPPIKGLLLSSPGFIPSVPVPPWKLRLSNLLLRWLPRLRFSTGIRPEQLTSSDCARRAFRQDPYVFARVSLRWYAEFRSATIDCLERAHELALPLFACVGSKDAIVSPEGTRRLFESVASTDKTLAVYEGMLHEPLNEIDGERVASTMIEWIANHARP